MDDDDIDLNEPSRIEDPGSPSPRLPVVVGDMVYLYRMDPNYDRSLDDIDWENLSFIEDTEPPVWDTRNYATREEADAALDKLFDDALDEVMREPRPGENDSARR